MGNENFSWWRLRGFSKNSRFIKKTERICIDQARGIAGIEEGIFGIPLSENYLKTPPGQNYPLGIMIITDACYKPGKTNYK